MANGGSVAPGKAEQSWGFSGCFVWGVLLFVALGVIALFPWAQKVELSVYPNINGIYVSIAATAVVGFILVVLYALRRVVPWLARLAAALIAIALLAWLVYSIWSWLFRLELG
jgi:hypothetical protein